MSPGAALAWHSLGSGFSTGEVEGPGRSRRVHQLGSTAGELVRCWLCQGSTDIALCPSVTARCPVGTHSKVVLFLNTLALMGSLMVPARDSYYCSRCPVLILFLIPSSFIS